MLPARSSNPVLNPERENVQFLIENLLINSLLQITTVFTLSYNTQNAQISTVFNYPMKLILWKKHMGSQSGWYVSTASLYREDAQAEKGEGLWYSHCWQSVNISSCYSSSQRMYLRTTCTCVICYSDSLSAFISTSSLYFLVKGNWNKEDFTLYVMSLLFLV